MRTRPSSILTAGSFWAGLGRLRPSLPSCVWVKSLLKKEGDPCFAHWDSSL
jgi:hypothetical protein